MVVVFFSWVLFCSIYWVASCFLHMIFYMIWSIPQDFLRFHFTKYSSTNESELCSQLSFNAKHKHKYSKTRNMHLKGDSRTMELKNKTRTSNTPNWNHVVPNASTINSIVWLVKFLRFDYVWCPVAYNFQTDQRAIVAWISMREAWILQMNQNVVQKFR